MKIYEYEDNDDHGHGHQAPSKACVVDCMPSPLLALVGGLTSPLPTRPSNNTLKRCRERRQPAIYVRTTRRHPVNVAIRRRRRPATAHPKI